MPEDVPRVRADPRALEQVLVNLVDNSIKYCPPGSRVVVRVEREGERRVRIAIEDTGPGIHEHDLPRIFERFYRVDAGRSRDMGGTGLGLSIVKHLVEAMGGNVGVDSRIGFGSKFWFTMPRADAELALPARAPIDINVDSERHG
jgi:two-component system phosphate regulon sensor histidine kinase PhoR